MKKTLSFILALLMCISLCACNSKADPEEEKADDKYSKAGLIESTPTLDINEMFKEARANYAKAKLDYDGQMFIVDSAVGDISDDHFECSWKEYHEDGRSWSICTITVELPMEDLATLSKGTRVTVLGKLSFVTDQRVNLEDAFIVDSSNDE